MVVFSRDFIQLQRIDPAFKLRLDRCEIGDVEEESLIIDYCDCDLVELIFLDKAHQVFVVILVPFICRYLGSQRTL